MSLTKISGVVIAFNEEAKIGRTLSSLRQVCDEVLVVDSFSTDSTPGICRDLADRFVQSSWQGYRVQKQFATDQAAHDWVLSLDADEVLADDLQSELLAWKGEEHRSDGYYIPRTALFMGRWIRHTTWYPDFQLRLFRRSKGKWEGGRVHESFKLSGSVGKLSGHILHYTYDSVSDFLAQLDRFSGLAAQDLWDAGRRVGLGHLALHPPATFLKNFVLKRGFLDGVPGFSVSMLSAFTVFFKYLKLMELQLAKNQGRKIADRSGNPPQA